MLLLHTTRRRPLLAAVGLTLVALVAAACGGDDEAAATTTVPASTTTTEAPTTTTTEAPPVMQLTGLPVQDELSPLRTTMIVKIDNNNSKARPQRGLTTADVVFEEAVENSESRFFAVFHTNLTDPVGPIRSARTSDIDLMSMFGRPSFSSSGGNPGTMGSIRDNDVAIVAGHDSQFGNFFFRMNQDGDLRRPGMPHNLFVNLTELYGASGVLGSPPPPFATWRGVDEDLPGTALPVIGADITFGRPSSQWVWDADADGFLRWQMGTPHVDTDGNQVTAANVLLLMTPYEVSPFDHRSPEAVTVGSGEAWVLTGGGVVHGTWNRADRNLPYTLLDEAGAEIALTPGQTWVELLKPANVPVFLDADPRG